MISLTKIFTLPVAIRTHLTKLPLRLQSENDLMKNPCTCFFLLYTVTANDSIIAITSSMYGSPQYILMPRNYRWPYWQCCILKDLLNTLCACKQRHKGTGVVIITKCIWSEYHFLMPWNYRWPYWQCCRLKDLNLLTILCACKQRHKGTSVVIITKCIWSE